MKKSNYVTIFMIAILCSIFAFIVNKYYGGKQNISSGIVNNGEKSFSQQNYGAGFFSVLKDIVNNLSKSPTPTATAFNCAGRTQSDCSSGAAASHCSWCRGGCKAKSVCTTPAPTATAKQCFEVIESAPKYMSPGDTYNGIKYNCNGTVSISSGASLAKCTNGERCEITINYQCQNLNITLTDSNGNKTSFTVKTRKPWTAISNITRCNRSPIPKMSKDANTQGVDIYGTCTPIDNNPNCVLCTNVHTRGCTTCDGCGDDSPGTCCYNSTNWRYSWSDSGTCPSGYSKEEGVSKDSCVNACYCKGNECGIYKVYDWANNGYPGWEPLYKDGVHVTSEQDCRKNTVTPTPEITPKPTPEPRYSYCCVDNELPGLSSNVFYVDEETTRDCNDYAGAHGKPTGSYTILDNYSREKCRAPEAVTSTCNVSNVVFKKDETASSCEGDVVLSSSDDISCTGFYTIHCDRNITTTFDYGDDSNLYSLRYVYQGEGFSYGINEKAYTNCQLRFIASTWKRSYNKFLDNIGLVSSGLVTYVKNNNHQGWVDYIDRRLSYLSKSNKSTLYGWWNIISNLQNIVNAYNNYENNIIDSNDGDENASILLTTKENEKTVTINSNYVVISEKDNVYRNEYTTHNLGLSGLTNPKDYDLDLTREVKLILTPTCLNKNSGEVEQDSCKDGSLSGGNKVYVGYGTDRGVYNMTIKVEGLGSSRSSITNTMCDVKVLGEDILYRPIDVGNPFIDDKWKKGENWINNKYDFTKTIHATTWSESTRSRIDLSANEISEIKSSNAGYVRGNYAPYLGICDTVKNKSSIDNKICNSIK